MSERRFVPIDEVFREVQQRQEKLYERPTPYRNDDQEFMCSYCLETFDRVSKRIEHETAIHPNGLACPICNRPAMNTASNGLHLSKAHGIRGSQYGRPGRRH